MENELKNNNKSRIIYIVFYILTIILITIMYINLVYKLKPTKYTCKIVNNEYYGSKGTKVDKETYESECIKELEIEFDNAEIDTNIKDAKEPIIEKAKINYQIKLKPNEYYKLDIDIVNKSEVDALIKEIIKSKVNESIEYNVTYKDGSEIKENDELLASETKRITLLIKYKDVEVENIDSNLNLSYEIKYVER